MRPGNGAHNNIRRTKPRRREITRPPAAAPLWVFRYASCRSRRRTRYLLHRGTYIRTRTGASLKARERRRERKIDGKNFGERKKKKKTSRNENRIRPTSCRATRSLPAGPDGRNVIWNLNCRLKAVNAARTAHACKRAAPRSESRCYDNITMVITTNWLPSSREIFRFRANGGYKFGSSTYTVARIILCKPLPLYRRRVVPRQQQLLRRSN